TQHHAHSIPAHSAKIVITVPNKAALKAVKLTLDSGNLVFKNLQLTQSSYAATDSGHIAMQNCDLQKIRLAFDTGKVILDKCKLRHLTMACDEGDVKIKQSQLLGKSRIVSDDLQLSLQDVNKDLSYHFIGSDISGSYYGKDIDGDKHFSHYKNSKNSLHILGDDLHLTVK
ncbi:hypothetical protein EQ500_11915, partial [Lactobacillus sp. XV13L]|nr:hypothetical protein [Lactobacillus sp. XV13L]